MQVFKLILGELLLWVRRLKNNKVELHPERRIKRLNEIYSAQTSGVPTVIRLPSSEFLSALFQVCQSQMHKINSNNLEKWISRKQK